MVARTGRAGPRLLGVVLEARERLDPPRQRCALPARPAPVSRPAPPAQRGAGGAGRVGREWLQGRGGWGSNAPPVVPGVIMADTAQRKFALAEGVGAAAGCAGARAGENAGDGAGDGSCSSMPCSGIEALGAVAGGSAPLLGSAAPKDVEVTGIPRARSAPSAELSRDAARSARVPSPPELGGRLRAPALRVRARAPAARAGALRRAGRGAGGGGRGAGGWHGPRPLARWRGGDARGGSEQPLAVRHAAIGARRRERRRSHGASVGARWVRGFGFVLPEGG